MPSEGVSKKPNSKSGHIEKLQKTVERAHEGALSRQELESGDQQTIVSDANPNMRTKPYPDENEPEQTQQNAPVDENSTPHPDKPIQSVKDDIEMTDFGANRKAKDQREPTQNSTLDVPSETNRSSVRSSREQSVGSLAKGLICLAILDPPRKNDKGRLTQIQLRISMMTLMDGELGKKNRPS